MLEFYTAFSMRQCAELVCRTSVPNPYLLPVFRTRRALFSSGLKARRA